MANLLQRGRYGMCSARLLSSRGIQVVVVSTKRVHVNGVVVGVLRYVAM